MTNKHPLVLFNEKHNQCFICGGNHPFVHGEMYYCSGCDFKSRIDVEVTIAECLNLIVKNIKFYLVRLERTFNDSFIYYDILDVIDEKLSEIEQTLQDKKVKNWALLNKENKNYRISFICKEILKLKEIEC